jgi:hypothetical protein
LHTEDKAFFELLKKEIVSAMMLSYPGINQDITEWKGQEITDFQEDLLLKVNGRISEKWFYTHIKTTNQTLPRIDVLNMLGKYAGYTNWDDFRFKNSGPDPLTVNIKKTNYIFLKVPALLLAIMILLFIIYRIMNTQNYRFSFFDADTGEPITNNTIQVDQLLKNESPLNYLCDKNGSFILRTDESRINLIVRSPYYHTDTIERILKKFNRAENIMLHADANALMIHYFSQQDTNSWKNRRSQLDKIFNEDAMIYQVPDNNKGGMEIYNKYEFIDKLTMPSSSLGNIEILDTKYKGDQIMILKFKINMN